MVKINGVKCGQKQACFKDLDVFNLWFGGCLSLVIAVPGFFGNIGAAYVLSQKGQSSFQFSVIFKFTILHYGNQGIKIRCYT